MANSAIFSYSEGDFDAAKAKANREGKMLLVDFYAAWCGPCKWMEETTFADPTVREQMSEDYITVKINIDDFDGYALKEHYEVKVLPTVLIFNNEGKIVERIEETIPPSKMRTLLDKNKAPKGSIVHNPNVAPSAADYTLDNSRVNARSERYTLQLGVFSTYASTLDYYQKVKPQLDQPMIVLNDYKGTSVIYRVLVGDFASTNDAEVYKTKLKEEYGIETTLFY